MRKAICIFTATLYLLLTLAGCGNDPYISTVPDTADEQAALYTKAADAALTAQGIHLQIETDTAITVGDETFTKQSRQSLTCLSLGSDSMRACMEETLTVGSNTVTLREQYAKGYGYFTVNDSRFLTAMTADAFRDRYAPAAVLTAELYGNITSQAIEEQILITFSQPSAGESWAIPEGATLVSASGQALLQPNGSLSCSTYQACYTHGSASFSLSVTVTVDTDSLSLVETPASTDGYIPLTDPDAPRLLEEACGYLTQATTVSATATELLTSDAFGYYRTQNSQLNMYGAGNELTALRETAVELINQSQGSETSQTHQTERFMSGKYTLETDGSAAETQQDITAEKMRTYCQELLVGTILLPEYIVSVVTENTGSSFRMDFKASEELAQLIAANSCNTLYDDPELLNNLASDHWTNSMTAYLEIDSITGLPIAAGICYSGGHTIQQTAYTLTFRSDQTYALAGEAAAD